ncbi:MAG: quinolinate synthase NadA [Thermoguttaceae bacterium]
MIKDIQEKIIKLKKEKNICILAHCYQTHDILEVADFTGDSFGLAQKAAATDCEGVIMCGVRFMAETCKILSPEKRVYLPRSEAGCPMAEQLDIDMLRQLQEMYKGIFEEMKTVSASAWLTVDEENLTITVTSMPMAADFCLPIEIDLVVEFLAR